MSSRRMPSWRNSGDPVAHTRNHEFAIILAVVLTLMLTFTLALTFTFILNPHTHTHTLTPPHRHYQRQPLCPDFHTGYTLCLLDVWLNSKVAAVVGTELNQASLKCALQSHLAIAASMAYSCLAACQWLDAALQWTSMSHAWLCCTAYCTNKACWPHDCSDSL